MYNYSACLHLSLFCFDPLNCLSLGRHDLGPGPIWNMDAFNNSHVYPPVGLASAGNVLLIVMVEGAKYQARHYFLIANITFIVLEV